MHEFQDSQLSSEDRNTRTEPLPIVDTSRFIQYQLLRYRVGDHDHAVNFHTKISRRNEQALDGLVNNKSDPARCVFKRGFDIAAATLSILVFLPALAAISLAIKLTSRGPIMFRQLRYGLNNKPFVIYKFRTMYSDETDVTGVKQTREDDERITPVGKLLRRFSLDEMPQLINIVRGDMSLVGPRPHVPG